MRYVVCVKPPDDHPAAVRVFGTFASKIKAMRFCTRVRKAIEDREAEDLDDQTGYAYVMEIEKPQILQAIAWAERGEE